MTRRTRRVAAARPALQVVLAALAVSALAVLASPTYLSIPAQDGAPPAAPWAAHAQEQQGPVEVKVGALMAPDDSFNDTKRIEALRYAVDEFNRQGSSVRLDLDVSNITRGAELEALVAAYANGTGPSYYVGPTTSAGLTSIREYANRSGIVLVSPASDATSLAVPGDTTFRLTISVDKQAHALARIMSNASIDTAVTIVRNDAWGRSLNSSLNEALGLQGIALGGSVSFADSGADWGAVAAAANESAAALPDASRAGIVFAGFGSNYGDMAAAVAAAGDAASAARSAPWFVPSAAIVASTLEPIEDSTVRGFSASVNLTALGHNAPPNAATAALDANLSAPSAGSDPERLTYYEYATYDSVFVLGTAMGMVLDASGGSGAAAPDPRAVAAAMPAAALAREGALGRIALNPAGDLLVPDAFGVWMVGPDGAWSRTGTAASGTPVTELGMLAILAGGHEANRVAAARLAVNDHNWAQEGANDPHYLHLSVHNITVDNSPPRALDVLRAAHDGGAGPSHYVGPSTSGNSKRLLGYANANGIVLVSPSATAPSLSIEGDSLFRLAPDDSQQGIVLANAMGRDLAGGAGERTIVVAARDDAWGRDLNATATGRLAELGMRVAPVAFGESADWPQVAQALNSAIGGSGAGAPSAVLFLGLAPDFIGIAPLASDAVPWYGPDSIAASRDVAADPAASSFADAVNLTATLFHAAGNAEQDRIRSELARAGVSALRIYDYSTYDSVRMLGAAIASATNGGGAGSTTGVAAAIPIAAAAYEGALGDIALNSKGDLRTPNDYALWTIRGGEWKRLEVFSGTPVARIGAIVSLDGASPTDAAKLEAMRLAADEYNRRSEAAAGPLYVDLEVVRASLVPAAATAASPPALGALEAAYAGGAGPSYYVGPSTSGNAARVLGFANANNITLVSPSSTAASLAIGGDALFRLAPNDALQGRVIADVIHNRQGHIIAGLINGSGVDAVVSLVRNDTWGRGLDASASERLASHGITVSRMLHVPHGADWPDIAGRLDSQIGSLQAAGSRVAVLHIGFQGDFAAIAGQAAGHGRIAAVPWYGTDGVAHGRFVVGNPVSLALADAANLTATAFDPPASPKRDAVDAALAARGVSAPGAYVYASYDAVHILAGAVEMALEERGASHSPADVRGMVRAAAAAYEGALGDVELGRSGDLRSPNGYATWAVEDGAWVRAGAHPPTPVVPVGALLVLNTGGGSYTDGAELGALEAAIDDFNTAHELVGDFYLGLEVHEIAAAPGAAGSSAPGALAGLEAARANGTGPSYYIGPTSSANVARVLGYANSNGLVLVSPSSAAESLSVAGDALFRMVPDYARQADALARVLSDRGATDIVLAVRSDAWGEGANTTLRAELAASAAPPTVRQVSFAEAGADWGAAAREIGAAAREAAQSAAARSPPGYAVVVFAGFDSDLAGIAAARAGMPPGELAAAEWIGAGAVGTSARVAGDADALALARAVNLTTFRLLAPANDIAARLDPESAYGPSAYDSVRVLGDAIRAAYDRLPPGNGALPAPADVAAAMQGAARAYAGALGNVTLNANGDLDWPSEYGVYSAGADGRWAMDGTVSAGPWAGPCPAGARCVIVGELYTAELGAAAREVHEAYMVGAEDFNRAQIESGAAPRLHAELRRAEVSILSPAEGLRAAHGGGSGPSAYLGPITSGSAAAMKPVIDEAGIVLVSPTSAAATGGLAERDTLFRLSMTDKYEADLLVLAARAEGVGVIVPAVRGDAYGSSYAAEIAAEGALLGIEVADAVVMEVDNAAAHGIADARGAAAELARAVAAAVEGGAPAGTVGVVVAATTGDLHALAGHALGHPVLVAAPWFEPGNLYPPRPIADAETLEFAAAVRLHSTSWDIPDTPRLAAVHDRLAAREGVEPHLYSYAAYDSVRILADAIGRSLAADGSYDPADVADEVPAAAARLDGLLGDGLVLDEHGDRVLPSDVVLWRTQPGTGAWAGGAHVRLDPFCAVDIRSAVTEVGEVGAGEPAAAAPPQGVRTAGTAPLAGLSVQAAPWTYDATGAEALPAGATQVLAPGGWSPLSAGESVEVARAGNLATGWNEISFRVGLGSGGVPAGAAGGPISQSVSYVAECG